MLALIFRDACFYTTGFAFKRALEHLGVPFQYVNNNAAIANPNLLAQFDSAFCCDDGFGLKPCPLPNLSANSAYFGIDLHQNITDNYLPYLHQFGHIFAGQYTYGLKVLESYGFTNVSHLPLAWDSLGIPYSPPDRERFFPVSFIASLTTEQRIYLSHIVRWEYDGATVECFHEELGKRLSDSKIGLGIQGGVGHEPHFTHVNNRVFETLGCGAMLLQQDLKNPFTGEHIPDFEVLGLKAVQGWFRDATPERHFWNRATPNGDEHYVSWHDATQLFETIRYYLDPINEQERAAIAERGRQFAQAHTYLERTKTILRHLGYNI